MSSLDLSCLGHLQARSKSLLYVAISICSNTYNLLRSSSVPAGYRFIMYFSLQFWSYSGSQLMIINRFVGEPESFASQRYVVQLSGDFANESQAYTFIEQLGGYYPMTTPRKSMSVLFGIYLILQFLEYITLCKIITKKPNSYQQRKIDNNSEDAWSR